MINFPLYEVRPYLHIFREGEYEVIETAKNRYVLDIVDEDEPLYALRRLSLLNKKLPYEAYPLNKRIETLSQIIISKSRKFIDKYGKVLTWVPSKFYPVVCLRVKASWLTDSGDTMVTLKGCATNFLIKGSRAPKYVQVVEYGEYSILFNTCDEYRKTTRKKL